jgi:sulfur-oxidizing protein SoxZ
MSNSIRVKTKQKGDVTNVKVLIRHPMETGLRKDSKTGQAIPANFIQEVNCQHNGKSVFQALWGIAVSKNPYLTFNVNDVKKGDTLNIGWLDNQGKSDAKSVTVK